MWPEVTEQQHQGRRTTSDQEFTFASPTAPSATEVPVPTMFLKQEKQRSHMDRVEKDPEFTEKLTLRVPDLR